MSGCRREDLEGLENRPAVGFFDLEGAQKLARETMQKKRLERAVAVVDGTGIRLFPQPMEIVFKPPTWREVARLFIPTFIISRQIRKMEGLIAHAPQSLATRFEQLLDRLDDKDPLSRLEVLKQAIVHWLMQSPNDARQAILEETQGEASLPSIDYPVPEFVSKYAKPLETGHE